jgi:hypothetical protein
MVFQLFDIGAPLSSRPGRHAASARFRGIGGQPFLDGGNAQWNACRPSRPSAIGFQGGKPFSPPTAANLAGFPPHPEIAILQIRNGVWLGQQPIAQGRSGFAAIMNDLLDAAGGGGVLICPTVESFVALKNVLLGSFDGGLLLPAYAKAARGYRF